MKIVVFGPDHRLGAIQGERILDLAYAAEKDGAAAGKSILSTLPALIDAGDRGLDLVRELLSAYEGGDEPGLHSQLHGTRLHAPFPGRRFALAGGNFAAHIANGYTNRGRPTTANEVRARARQGKAGGFYVVSTPVGPDAEIEVPRSADGLLDYEGEVAVVLGTGGKRLDAASWGERIWGTVLVIDWSIRSRTSIEHREPFYAHKNFDGSKFFGPWIAVDEVDPGECDVETRLNGEVRQRFNTRDMIHSFGELLAQMSEDLTLDPGDVLSGGTGPGTAVDSTVAGPEGYLPLDRFPKPGDVLEVSSPHLGTLRARVAAGS